MIHRRKGVVPRSGSSQASVNNTTPVYTFDSFPEPQAIIEALSRIDNPRSQTRAYQSFLSKWIRSDFEAASQWALETPLPDHIRPSMQYVMDRHYRRMQLNTARARRDQNLLGQPVPQQGNTQPELNGQLLRGNTIQ